MDTVQDAEPHPNLGDTWLRFVNLLDLVQERLQLREKGRRLQALAAAHPIQAFVVGMVLSLCSIPVAIFILFACISVTVTLISFLFFEGFLLVFGAVALGGSVIIFAIIALVLSAVIIGAVATFFGGRRVVFFIQANRTSWTDQAQHYYCHFLRCVEQWASTLQPSTPSQHGTGDNQQSQSGTHED